MSRKSVAPFIPHPISERHNITSLYNRALTCVT
jgi:nitrate reductase cytochrome c-type subunit